MSVSFQNYILGHLIRIANEQQEHMICLTLNTKLKVINSHLVFKGTVSGMLIHPREIYRRAIDDSAYAIIIAHNHPSGTAEPSGEDTKSTQQIEAAGQIVGIRLFDHYIVTGKKHFSFRANGHIYRDEFAEPTDREEAI